MAARKAILVSCGSFNPPTLAHLRMMELAYDHLRSLPTPYTIVEGIFSPVSSAYVHKPLAGDEHRLNMIKKATESSIWLRGDDWEMSKGEWSRTRQVLQHFRTTVRRQLKDDTVSCMLVCGGDLVDSFKRILPDGRRLWSLEDIKAIVEDYGIVVISREGSSPLTTLAELGFSSEKCHIVEELACPNDISSTRLRNAVAEGRSIRYCTPDGVVDYIAKHGLYRNPADTPKQNGCC